MTIIDSYARNPLPIPPANPGRWDTSRYYRVRPDLCHLYGHPATTYNPLHDVSACLCGARWFDGEPATVGLFLRSRGGLLTSEIEVCPDCLGAGGHRATCTRSGGEAS